MGQAQDHAGGQGHGAAALVAEDAGLREQECAPSRFYDAAATCQDVAHPIRIRPICQGDNILAGAREDVYGCPIPAMSLPPAMHHNAEGRQACRQAAGEAVGYPFVEARYRLGQGHRNLRNRGLDHSVMRVDDPEC